MKKDMYDPNAVEETPRSSLVTRKDLIKGAVILFVLTIMGCPIYGKMLEDRNKQLCKRNLGEISQALLLYSSENSDRLPPVYEANADGSARLSDGRAYTWISNVSPYVSNPTVFECPACKEDEFSLNEGAKGDAIKCGYGMFGALNARPLSDIANQQSEVMISETSNGGSQDSYNPTPIVGFDGFMIGFEKTNFLPDDAPASRRDSALVSRLAFRGTKTGIFGEKGSDGKMIEKLGRHNGGNHFVFADGHIETRGSRMMQIERIFGKEITGHWSIP
ncbi:MAG: hypothetical protein ABL949_01870 [Fimbriimonadaceae bacterium]